MPKYVQNYVYGWRKRPREDVGTRGNMGEMSKPQTLMQEMMKESRPAGFVKKATSDALLPGFQGSGSTLQGPPVCPHSPCTEHFRVRIKYRILKVAQRHFKKISNSCNSAEDAYPGLSYPYSRLHGYHKCK